MSAVRDLIKSLSFEEKLDLLDELWAEIVAESPVEIPLPHRQLLAERQKQYEVDPGQAIPWHEIRDRLRERFT